MLVMNFRPLLQIEAVTKRRQKIFCTGQGINFDALLPIQKFLFTLQDSVNLDWVDACICSFQELGLSPKSTSRKAIDLRANACRRPHFGVEGVYSQFWWLTLEQLWSPFGVLEAIHISSLWIRTVFTVLIFEENHGRHISHNLLYHNRNINIKVSWSTTTYGWLPAMCNRSSCWHIPEHSSGHIRESCIGNPVGRSFSVESPSPP